MAAWKMSTVGLTEHQKNHTAVDALKLQIMVQGFLPPMFSLKLLTVACGNLASQYEDLVYTKVSLLSMVYCLKTDFYQEFLKFYSRLSENVTHNYKQVSYDIMTPEYQF